MASGVSRKTLSTLLNGHACVSPEMAIRLEKVIRFAPPAAA
jgi:plasmid maintenance system antidote protein VapI